MSRRSKRRTEEGEEAPVRDDAVALSRVSKKYRMGDRDVHALREVSMTVPTGTLAVIQGPSGSGKTTLLNLIGAMDTPTSGSVRVGGSELSRMSDDALTEFRRRNVGFVFQFFNLINTLNAVENVMVPAMFQDAPPLDRALELLGRVGLEGRWDHRPAQLSGGERQRLAVARALVNDPALILADEPTGNLDHDIGGSILDLFGELVREGRTVLVVTHDTEVARRGENRFELRDGRLSGPDE